MSSALGLTDAQETAIEQIVADEKSAAEPLAEQLRTTGDQLRELGTDGTFDEARVRALAVQASQAQVELTVIRERAKAKVFAALTAEQRAQLAEKAHKMGPPRPGA
jgi:Spy/CpxP family protein refolding chaperone